MSEKPVLRILPRWDPDEPRFVVEECEKCSDDRAFKNNKCVYNQRLGFAYSVDEIVEVLNNTDELNELKKENNNLKKALWEAEENYLYEAYYDNSVRREDKLQNLKEDFKREYWND